MKRGSYLMFCITTVMMVLVACHKKYTFQDKPADVFISAAAAGDVESCRRMILAGYDVNSSSSNKWGWTALHAAAFKGSAETVRFLLENKAEPMLTDIHGDTPLHIAVRQSNASNIVFLLVSAGARPDYTNKSGVTPFSLLSSLSLERSNAVYQAMLRGRSKERQ